MTQKYKSTIYMETIENIEWMKENLTQMGDKSEFIRKLTDKEIKKHEKQTKNR